VRTLTRDVAPLDSVDLAQTLGDRRRKHDLPADVDPLGCRQLVLGRAHLGSRVQVVGRDLDVGHALDDVDLAAARVSSLSDADEQRAAVGVGERGQRRGQGTGTLLGRLEFQRLAFVVFFDEAQHLTRVYNVRPFICMPALPQMEKG